MSHKEKWQRLNNAKTHYDCSLSLSESDLRGFHEGRKILLGIRMEQRRDKQSLLFMRNAGEMARQTIDKIAIGVFHEI